MEQPAGHYRLVGADGRELPSAAPGLLGDNRRSRLYGRLDCPSAVRAVARGGPYAEHRVFFADEAAAVAAGYRPCTRCLPEQFAAWRAAGGLRRPLPPRRIKP